jgi:hypothetical protein
MKTHDTAIKVKHANSQQIKQLIAEFRAEVFTQVSKTPNDLMIPEACSFPGSESFYSMESDRITCTLDTITLDQGDLIPYKEESEIQTWLKFLKPEQISYSSKLMFAHSHRRNRTILSLLKAHYKFLCDRKIAINLVFPQEPLQSFYEWVGYRQYARNFFPGEALWPLVPMVLIVDDHEYLRRIDSPLHEAWMDKVAQTNTTLLDSFEQFFSLEFTHPKAYIHLRHLAQKYSVFFKNELMRPYIDAFKYRRFPKGKEIFAKGQYGSSLYIVISGKVAVEGREDIGTANLFGISCLLNPGPRIYTAHAGENLELLELDSADFYSIIKNKPQTAEVILNLIGARLRDATF